MKKMNIKTIAITFTLVFIIILVYLFANIKQKQVVCEKVKRFEGDVLLKENLVTTFDGNKITAMTVTKTITLPEKYADASHLERIKNSLNNTLEYLGDKVSYTIVDNNRIIVNIDVHKNEIILLDNINFSVKNDLEMVINSNTKSADVVALMIGDNYTDGEFMKFMKNKEYSCN